MEVGSGANKQERNLGTQYMMMMWLGKEKMTREKGIVL